MTLEKYLRQAIEAFASRPVLIGPEGTFTYRELGAEAARCSQLLADAGCEPGRAVVAQLTSGLPFLALLVSCIERRVVFAPVSPSLASDRVLEIAESLGARALCEEGKSGLSIRSLESAPCPQYCSTFAQGGFSRHTSGTTGKSKGVFVSMESALCRVLSARDGLDLPDGVRMLWPLEMALHFVSVLPVVLFKGGSFILPRGGSPAALAETIAEDEPDFMYGAPLHYRLLLENSPARHALKRAFSTTAPLDDTVSKRFEERFGVPLHQVYGIFEAGIVGVQSAAGQGSIPLPGVSLSIRDDDGREVDGGEIGRVFIASEGLLDAYLEPFRTRREILADGWFETGDLGRVSDAGGLSLVGRAVSVINVGGAKIFPEEVEGVLCSAPGVYLARASARRHATLGSVVHAEVVMKPGASFDEAELRKLCRNRLDRYAVPHRIEEVHELPLTVSGKIRRVVESASNSAADRR